MPHEPLRMDGAEVTPLCDGWAPLPLDDECPGHAVDWGQERGRFPWGFPEDDLTSWAWHVHAFLVRNGRGLTLVDTGIGHLGRPPYDVESRIDDELALAGATPIDIAHVIHTHLHADHAGGACLPDGTPRFPNAVHHVHPADWAFFEGAHGAEDFNARAPMNALQMSGMLELDPRDREVAGGIGVVHTPGHTPGHRAVIVREAEETLLLTGDLLHVTPQIPHPEWPSSHDEDPGEASAQRTRMLQRAREGAWWVGVSHFARPFGRVGPDGWRETW